MSELSIVVPVLNEAERIPWFLRHLRERAPGCEIVVVDGGSADGTAERVGDCSESLGVRLVRSPRGRARQMNAGAAAAGGALLWFVHADSELPPGAATELRAATEDPLLVGGCFRLRFDEKPLIYRVSDTLGNVGVDLFRIALGDHGIFCRRPVFEAVGGYPEVALLEDAYLYRLLARSGSVRQLRPEIRTSARAYRRYGPYRTTLTYALILAGHVLGATPEALQRLFRRLMPA